MAPQPLLRERQPTATKTTTTARDDDVSGRWACPNQYPHL